MASRVTDPADCAATGLLQLWRSGQALPVEATRAVQARTGRQCGAGPPGWTGPAW